MSVYTHNNDKHQSDQQNTLQTNTTHNKAEQSQYRDNAPSWALWQARRVLKPGGMLLHYELPSNNALSAYDGFYLDWDCWYNNEPFYKAYRDQDPATLCAAAGFAPGSFFQTVVPSLAWYGEAAVTAALAGPASVGTNTGRLADGVQWFVYGAHA